MPRIFICWIARSDYSIQSIKFSMSSYYADLCKARDFCDNKDNRVGNWIRKSYYFFRDDLYPELKRQEFMEVVKQELLGEEEIHRKRGQWGRACNGNRCVFPKSHYLNLRDCKYYCFYCASKITLEHGEGVFEYQRKEPRCQEQSPQDTGTP